jgi:transcriptional regulator with XRE-family HTH domain
MNDIKTVFGSNIRKFRTSLGLSQAKLAEAVGTATNYLGLIECGKNFPSAEMIERISKALGRDPLELFTLKPIKLKWQKDLLAEIEKFISARMVEEEEETWDQFGKDCETGRDESAKGQILHGK